MKLPKFQQAGKPRVKRKVRCRLNLAGFGAGNEAPNQNPNAEGAFCLMSSSREVRP
jgi:hypothetical protein